MYWILNKIKRLGSSLSLGYPFYSFFYVFLVVSQAKAMEDQNIALRTNPITTEIAPTEVPELTDDSFVAVYKKGYKPEKGPVRIGFVVDEKTVKWESWDDNFYLRHIILREIKKGFTSYMYEFESDIISPASQCNLRNRKKHLGLTLQINEIKSVGFNLKSKALGKLELDSTIRFNYSQYDSKVLKLRSVSFGKLRNNKYKLSRSSIRALRMYGFNTAENYISNNIKDLMSFLYRGVAYSDEVKALQITACVEAMTYNLAEMNYR